MTLGLCRFEWKPQDLWVGLFWKHTYAKTDDGEKPIATTFWLCFIPCVPLRITVWHSLKINH